MQSNTAIVADRVLDDQGRSFLPGAGVTLTAFLAMLTVQLFRADHATWLPILLIETALFAVLPLCAYCILRRRIETNISGWTSKKAVFGFQCGAILIGAIVIVWHASIRPFGFGEANEVVALLVVQSIGWYLAVFSKVPGFERASFVLCGAIVFFVCCMADQFEVFVVTGLFAFAGLWWLLGHYWNRLDAKAIDGNSRTLELHGSALSLATILIGGVICIAASIPFSQNGLSVAGFMPFSGGERGHQDEFALSGIGDGNTLTAGNNATTTGAVDSDQFIEDHKPSLYDVMSEKYNGPVVKRDRNRTVALDAMAKHLDKAKQSEQAGRTFRTMRNSDQTTNIELEDRVTKALFFLEGSVPARFAINTYQNFDGWDWSLVSNVTETAPQPRITLSKITGVPVFCIARKLADYLTGRRSHCVKIMRLDSDTIPAPAFLSRWHISQVDQLDMFGWSDAGLICFDGDSIPSHTVIKLQSLVPNYHLLRSDRNLPVLAESDTAFENGSLFLQVPDNDAKPITQTLASTWTTGVEPGWKQVEAIVDHMRKDFALSPAWETDEHTDDTVSKFLNHGGGPSYMFATTCAMALRSAGFKTRLTSGFLVQKGDYDSRAGQSIVTSDNLHMWPEVCLDGCFWIPVEPTPGYPIPYSTQTLWQWTTAQAHMLLHWVLNNLFLTILFVSAVFLCIYFRAEVVTTLMFLWWFFVRVFWPDSLLKTTRQLIDLRFWFAGDRRPESETISVWYKRVERNTPARFFDLWNAKNFCNNVQTVSRSDLAVICRGSIDSLTLKNIRGFLNVRKKADKQ